MTPQAGVLKDIRLGLFESLGHFCRTGLEKGVRPTVSLCVVHKDSILLVRDKKSGNWGLPQGSLNDDDRILYDSVLRTGFDEIGLGDHEIHPPRFPLGEFYNPMPKERGHEFREKRITMVALTVQSKGWLRRTTAKNSDAKFVGSFAELAALMKPWADARTVKYGAICDAIRKLKKHKFLSWSCDDCGMQ